MVNNYKRIDIIGGGIIGLTLATELLREIKKNNLQTEVHLHERRLGLGDENSTKCIECVRPYWPTPEEILHYQSSINAMTNLTKHFGDDAKDLFVSADYRPSGYHYFLDEKEYQAAFAKKEFFQSQNVPINFFDKKDAQKISWIENNFDLDGIIMNEDGSQYNITGYVHVPTAGFVSAGNIIGSYKEVFEKLGGKIHTNSKVVDIETNGNKITKIKYHNCRMDGNDNENLLGEPTTEATDYVVNAAGTSSDVLNELFTGEKLGIEIHRRIVHNAKPPKGYNTSPNHGLVILKSRMIRPETARADKIWLYYSRPDEEAGIHPPDKEIPFDEYLEKFYFPVFGGDIEKSFIRRMWDDPDGLRFPPNNKGWLGHYDDSPDHNPFVGVPWPEILNNYAVNTGGSGHNVMGAIAAALKQAKQILHGEEFVPSQYQANRIIKGHDTVQSLRL